MGRLSEGDLIIQCIEACCSQSSQTLVISDITQEGYQTTVGSASFFDQLSNKPLLAMAQRDPGFKKDTPPTTVHFEV